MWVRVVVPLRLGDWAGATAQALPPTCVSSICHRVRKDQELGSRQEIHPSLLPQWLIVLVIVCLTF